MDINQYIKENNINAEHLVFSESCHSVEEAASAARADPADFIKSICIVDDKKNLYIAILKGEDRLGLKKIAAILGLSNSKVRFANAEEVLQMTGYPAGGVPPFGFFARFFIDRKVLDKDIVFGGGGDDHSLIRASPQEIARINNAEIVECKKN